MPVLVQGTDPLFVLFGGADLRVERAVIDDVVAVRAARPGLQVGRRIAVGDAQVVQIGHDRQRVAERESRVKLQAVGRFGQRPARRPRRSLADSNRSAISVGFMVDSRTEWPRPMAVRWARARRIVLALGLRLRKRGLDLGGRDRLSSFLGLASDQNHQRTFLKRVLARPLRRPETPGSCPPCPTAAPR